MLELATRDGCGVVHDVVADPGARDLSTLRIHLFPALTNRIANEVEVPRPQKVAVLAKIDLMLLQNENVQIYRV